MRTVICGPVVRKTEPYNRDVSEVIVEDRCLGLYSSISVELFVTQYFMMFISGGRFRVERGASPLCTCLDDCWGF